MTVLVQNTEVTNTFDFWRARTNQLSFAMSNSCVTVNSNTAVGNAAITGTFTSNIVVSNTSFVNTSISIGNSTVNVVANSTTIRFSNATINTYINSTSASLTSSLFIGSAVANAFANTTLIALSNTVSNINITIPTPTQVANTKFYLNANSSWVYVPENLVITNTGLSGTGPQVIDSFVKTNYRSADYQATITNNIANGFAVARFLVYHDNGDAYITEYATMFSNGALASFTASTNTTHVIVYCTPVFASVAVKTARILM
jgi:hypothetical protein